jgi:uncharacterized membrane protein
MIKQEWFLNRNCSIMPRQLGHVYTALCTASLSIAVFFTLRGAWYVLGFAILEMSAVGFAFLLYACHATDREHIALVDDCLLVELIQAEQVRRYRLDPRRTCVEPPVSRGTRIEVGRF